jgi:DNA-binding PadR family transcriptional regulator
VPDKKRLTNPLALAVMTLLCERPMHPYEMAFVLRSRGKHESVRLNYGSLYTVVEALERQGFIVAQETVREGRRPEKTVYAITDAGRAEAFRWLRTLLRKPVKEYPQFEAGLSFIPLLGPNEAVAALEERSRLLAEKIEALRFALETLVRGQDSGLNPPLPRIVLAEGEYELTMLEAEAAWVARFVAEIKDGTIPFPELRDGEISWTLRYSGDSAAEARSSAGDEKDE